MGAVVVLVWVACAALGYVVGRNKGRGMERHSEFAPPDAWYQRQLMGLASEE